MVSRASLNCGFTVDAANKITPAQHQQLIRNFRAVHPRTRESPRCDTEALVLQHRSGKHRDTRLVINNLALDVDLTRARNSILEEDQGIVWDNHVKGLGFSQENDPEIQVKLPELADPEVPKNILSFGNSEVPAETSGFADPKAPVKKLRFAEPEVEAEKSPRFDYPEVPGAPVNRAKFSYPELPVKKTRFADPEVQAGKSRFADLKAQVKKDKKAKKVDLVDPDSRVRKASLRSGTQAGTADVRPKSQDRTVNIRTKTTVRIVDVRKSAKNGESTKAKVPIANEEPPKKEEPGMRYVPTNGDLPMEERVHHGLPPFFSDPTMPVDILNNGRPGYIIEAKPNSLPPHHCFHTPINTAKYPDLPESTNFIHAMRLRSRVRYWIKYMSKLNNDVGFPGMHFKDGKLRGIVFAEGFMILDPADGGGDSMPRNFDVTLFLSATREGTRKRRFEREKYKEPLKKDHMTWREASYFDGVAWPAFVAEHRWIFDMTPEQANEGLMPTFNFGNVSDLAKMRSIMIRPGELGIEMTLLWAVNAMLYQFGKKEKFARDRWVEAMNGGVWPVVQEWLVDENDLKMMFEMEKKSLATKDKVALISRDFAEVVRDGEVAEVDEDSHVSEVDEVAQIVQVAEVDDLVGLVNLAGLAEFDEDVDLVDLDTFGEITGYENIDPQLFSLGDVNGENVGAGLGWGMEDNNLVGEPLFEDGFFSGEPFFFDDDAFIENALSGNMGPNEGLVEYQDYSPEFEAFWELD